MSSSFSPSQLHALEATERACSALSFAISAFVLGSYLGSNLFQTPINRLIFFATFGNVLADVGIMIGRAGVERGQDSALCQFQGFFIQWFLVADSLWSFCMAFNVYLTLFRRYSTPQLKKLEWRYFLLSYGLPFVVPFVLLFISSASRGKVFGRAILWCWIRPEWAAFRIGLVYGPVWFVLALTFSIYLYAGKEILKSRRRLRKLESDHRGSDAPDRGEVQNGATQPDTARDEQPQSAQSQFAARTNAPGNGTNAEHDFPPVTMVPAIEQQAANHSQQATSSSAVSQVYVPDTSSESQGQDGSGAPVVVQECPGTQIERSSDSSNSGTNSRLDTDSDQPQSSTTPRATTPNATEEPSAPETEEARQIAPARAGVNRVETNESRIDDSEVSVGREQEGPRADAITDLEAAPTMPAISGLTQTQSSGSGSLLPWPSAERHTAAYLYAERAMLFFLSLLMTWIPASVHRTYLLDRPDNPNYALTYVTGFVLPLQGFWNGLVYIATSYGAVKALFANIFKYLRSKVGVRAIRHGNFARGLSRIRRPRRTSQAPRDTELEQRGSAGSGDGLNGGSEVGRIEEIGG